MSTLLRRTFTSNSVAARRQLPDRVNNDPRGQKFQGLRHRRALGPFSGGQRAGIVEARGNAERAIEVSARREPGTRTRAMAVDAVGVEEEREEGRGKK